MNKKIEIGRIKKGWRYFYDMKPSKFNQLQKIHLTRYLNLLKPLIDSYKEEEEKSSDEKVYELAKKIF